MWLQVSRCRGPRLAVALLVEQLPANGKAGAGHPGAEHVDAQLGASHLDVEPRRTVGGYLRPYLVGREPVRS